MAIEILILLFFVGLTAGLVDSIAGGGGLIVVPALLLAGLPPPMVLGTNKFQGTFGTFSASVNFIRKGHINFKDVLPGIIFTLVGASGGAVLVQSLDLSFIEAMIPFLMLAVFLYTIFSHRIERREGTSGMNPILFYGLFGLGLGFYDGFFGPGTGSLWTFSHLFFLRYGMIRSVGCTKVMNLTSNLAALIWFIMEGNIVYSVGIVMAGGQLIGAAAGSSLAMKKGARIIKPVYLTVVLLTIVRLLYNLLFS